jgi:hypothetical protein
LPERMLWTEKIFAATLSRFNKLYSQILIRFSFLLILWLIGAVIYASDGLLVPYVSSIGVYEGLYLPGLIILLGSYGVQRSLEKIIISFTPLLDLDDAGFRDFRKRVENVVYSFYPCLMLGLVFAIFLSGVSVSVANLMAEGLKPRFIWELFTAVFFDLLSGTGVWMFLGIWYTIFEASHQKFHVDLLDRVSESFRLLMQLTLYYAVFYFITVSVAVGLPMLSTGSSSWMEVVISSYLAFVAFGVASVVFPLYNIHTALVKLKAAKLAEIRFESNALIRRLEEAKGDDLAGTLSIMAGLQAVQVKENYIMSAPEWPVNMDFLGKLAGLVILPTVVRVFIELFRSYLPI